MSARPTSIVIVGAGFAGTTLVRVMARRLPHGVEVAGELVDCLHSIRRYDPQVRPDERQVTVLHGTEANPLACKLGLPMAGGRIVVAPDLSVPEHPGVWALGDCTAVPNALDGTARL